MNPNITLEVDGQEGAVLGDVAFLLQCFAAEKRSEPKLFIVGGWVRDKVCSYLTDICFLFFSTNLSWDVVESRSSCLIVLLINDSFSSPASS